MEVLYEGIASGNYHIYESHSSGRDNDFRVTGEDAITLSDDQVVDLDDINPIGYSTQSDTVPGGYGQPRYTNCRSS